jgi:hypothetical protein
MSKKRVSNMSVTHYILTTPTPYLIASAKRFLERCQENEMNCNFVIFYRRGPAWIEGKSVFEQALQRHLS